MGLRWERPASDTGLVGEQDTSAGDIRVRHIDPDTPAGVARLELVLDDLVVADLDWRHCADCDQAVIEHIRASVRRLGLGTQAVRAVLAVAPECAWSTTAVTDPIAAAFWAAFGAIAAGTPRYCPHMLDADQHIPDWPITVPAPGPRWTRGNAAVDAGEHRGWFVGAFLDPDSPRYTADVEVKWGVHAAGEQRTAWTDRDRRTTLVVLVSGRLRVDLADEQVEEVVLDQAGDYVLWGPGVDHTWEALTEAVVVTVRWDKRGD